MERKVRTLTDHFDPGLTPTGVTIGLVMVASCIGGLLSLSSGNYWLGIPLLSVFLILLIALMAAAVRTDPALRMTRKERLEKWKAAPTFVRVGLYLLLAGPFLSLVAYLVLPDLASIFTFPMLGATLASLVFAYGMQTTKPPIPRLNQEPLTFELSPDLYLKQLRPAVLSLYFTALISGAICILFFVK